jgi:DNA/RNA endonuclease G (NUC1)
MNIIDKNECKHFLYANTMTLYEVPKKYWNHIDIIKSSSRDFDDNDVNKSIKFLIENCKAVIYVEAVSQFL